MRWVGAVDASWDVGNVVAPPPALRVERVESSDATHPSPS
jgi:hypothetical protein